MRVHWYRVRKTYENPHGGFLAIGPRYPSVLSDDSLVVLFTHRAAHSWTEVVPVEQLEEVEKDPPRRRR